MATLIPIRVVVMGRVVAVEVAVAMVIEVRVLALTKVFRTS
jgi:hypothetical protein